MLLNDSEHFLILHLYNQMASKDQKSPQHQPSPQNAAGPCADQCGSCSSNNQACKALKGLSCLECYSERICGMSIEQATVRFPTIGLVSSVIILIVCIIAGMNGVLGISILSLISYALAMNAVNADASTLKVAAGLLLILLLGESISYLVIFIITLLPFGLIVLAVGAFKLAVGYFTFLAISSLSVQKQKIHKESTSTNEHLVVDFTTPPPPPPQYSPPGTSIDKN